MVKALSLKEKQRRTTALEAIVDYYGITLDKARNERIERKNQDARLRYREIQRPTFNKTRKPRETRNMWKRRSWKRQPMIKRRTFGIKADRSLKQNIVPKPKRSFIDKWTLKKADEQFSLFIRHRDGKCVRCGATSEFDQLQNSHFWGRIWKGTRYDPENCDTLCATCHYWGDSKRKIVAWEEEKQGEYRRFKINQLGIEKYNEMELRAHIDTKNDIEVLKCRKFLMTQEYNGKPKYLKLAAASISA